MESKHNHLFMLAFERQVEELKDPCNFWQSLAFKVLRILLVKQIIAAHGSGVQQPCFAGIKNQVKYILPYRLFEMYRTHVKKH